MGALRFEGLSKKTVENAIEGSLKRLGVDCVDLYYIHVDWRWEPLEETLEALNGLVEDNERRLLVIKEIAKARGVTPFRVMFAWMLSRKVSIVPILGVSKISQLEDNLGALDLTLTDAEVERLDNAAFNGKTYKDPEEVKLS